MKIPREEQRNMIGFRGRANVLLQARRSSIQVVSTDNPNQTFRADRSPPAFLLFGVVENENTTRSFTRNPRFCTSYAS